VTNAIGRDYYVQPWTWEAGLMRSGDVKGTPIDCLQEYAGLSGSAKDPRHDSGSGQLMRLSRTIEGEIIPRLMMLLKPESSGFVAAEELFKEPAPIDYSVDELVQMLLRHDAAAATRYVTALRSAGMPLPSIYLDLLAPAARILGIMWEKDECSFSQVTVAVAKMHQVLLQFSPCFCASIAEEKDDSHTAIIVPMPGEQHTFGLFMVVEFFRRAGWNIWSGNPATQRDLIDVIRTNTFELLGYSVAADRHLGHLKEQISEIRSKSKNPRIKIMVGGRAFTDNPTLFKEVGADATARDGQDAVVLAAELVKPV